MVRREGDWNISKDQKEDMYQLFSEGKRAKEVSGITGLRERTVYHYQRRYIENKEMMTKDQPAVWENIKTMQEMGIATEHLSQLISVSAWATWTFGPSGLFETHPSYRTLRWQSYALTYADSVRLSIDIWVIGELFAHRELCYEFAKKPIYKEDLDAWLSFKPWESSMKEIQYEESVRKGLVPQIRAVVDLNKAGSRHRAGLALFISMISNNRKLHNLLPSQQIEIALQGKPDKVFAVVLKEDEETIQIPMVIES